MTTKKFIWQEFNSVIQEELINTKFANFGESLLLALAGYNKYIQFLWV